MKIFTKYLLLFTILVQLDACRWFSSASPPFFKWSNITIPPGSPVFKQAFKDGCSTVLAARGNVWYRTRYSYAYDPKLIGNPEYRFGHSRGYNWCFMNIVASEHQSSFDRYIAPKSTAAGFGVFDTSVPHIGVTWSGMTTEGGGGLDAPIAVFPANGFNSIFDVLQKGSGGGTTFGGNPLWAGGSVGQFMGQQYNGSYYGN